jgi:uncharacterized protein
LFISITALQYYANHTIMNETLFLYITADYIPPFLPFMLSTFGFALMLIALFMFLGSKLENNPWAKLFASTGQMTLSHYISHLTVGMILFSWISGRSYIDMKLTSEATSPLFILTFAIAYFIVTCLFSKLWSNKFKNGPIETLMRKISG